MTVRDPDISSGEQDALKVAIFNVKYSPNLGDGLLSECLERELANEGQIHVTSFDLAGRSHYGESASNRQLALSVLEVCPPPIRRLIVRTILGRSLSRRLRPQWRKALAAIDAVVVGGGNLLADHDLNFPLKIAAALDEARNADVPAAVFGVGVSDNWSKPGQKLFQEAMLNAKLFHAAVRDERSQAIWTKRLGSVNIQPAEICRDPGVLAARHFPGAAKSGETLRVALGVTDPLALRYHAADTAVDEADLTDWLAQLVEALSQSGGEVLLFTNGSPEDRAYLAKIAPRLIGQRPDRVKVIPPFPNPAALSAFISGADIVLAHRLHACIAAFAYAIPHIGFVWDPKLDAFFASTGRSAYVAQPCKDTPEAVVELARAALRAGVDRSVHQGIIADARDDVARLRQAIVVAAGRTKGTV